ncbi:MAG TPA: RHS repeat-associated core domain-containing protein [Candidatus Deferrimicrobiaceae bacterium]|jgi:RHS repeat-associated protein
MPVRKIAGLLFLHMLTLWMIAGATYGGNRSLPNCPGISTARSISDCRACHDSLAAQNAAANPFTPLKSAAQMSVSSEQPLLPLKYTQYTTSPDGKMIINYPISAYKNNAFNVNMTLKGYDCMLLVGDLVLDPVTRRPFIDPSTGGTVINQWLYSTSIQPWYPSTVNNITIPVIYSTEGHHGFIAKYFYYPNRWGDGFNYVLAGGREQYWETIITDPLYCDLAIATLTANNRTDNTTINTSAGDNVTFNALITSATYASTPGNVTWNLVLTKQAGGAVVKSWSGTGLNLGTIVWNGVCDDHALAPAASYIATLTANTPDNCSAVSTVKVNVVNDETCPIRAPFGSTANIASGSLSHTQELFSVRGGALPASFALTYNSFDGSSFPLGKGWTHSYNVSLAASGVDAYTLTEGDGSQTLLLLNPGDNIYHPRTAYYPYLVAADNASEIYLKDGGSYLFDGNGKFIRIEDKNGNGVNLTYDPAYGDLTAITDPAGRVTTLNYNSDNRLAHVIAPGGRVFAFEYDDAFRDHLQRIVAPDNSASTFIYDPTWGRMQTRTDPLNNTTTYQYDDQGRVNYSLDPEGGEKRIVYDSASAISTVTEKDGGVWYWRYDRLGGTLLQKQDPDGKSQWNVYDDFRNLTSSTDPDGGVTNYTYDDLGDTLTATDPMESTTTYTYDNFGRMTSSTDPANNTTQFFYDAHGNLTDTTDPTGATTHSDYNANGYVLRTVDPQGRITSYTYDPIGNVASATDNATGNTIGFVYDNNGNLLQRTDANGAVTTYVYDGNARLKSVTDPLGHKTSYGYDANGNRISETDANGKIITFEYDSKGHLTKTINPLGGITVNSYGGSGCSSCGGGKDRLMEVTDPAGRTTRYEYDLLGRKTKVTDPAGAFSTYTYDARGNLATATDNNGHTMQYFYDPSSRLYAQVDARGGLTWFDFTPAGQTDNVFDANGNRTHYAYDNTGKLSRTASPDTGSTTNLYNLDGTLHSRIDANGTTITYTYDTTARLTGVAFPDQAQNITFSYDSPASSFGKGRLTGMVDPAGVTTYQYDALGRIVQEQKNILGILYTTGYGYDNVGNLSAITYPNGRTVDYTFDALRRVTGVTGPVNGSAANLAGSFAYDNTGLPLSYTLGNGIVQSFSYDNVGRVSTIDAPGVMGYSYQYDPTGNILSINDRLRTTPLLPPDMNTTTYAYQANRLATVTDAGIPSQYVYDNVGNTNLAGSRTLVYNQNQRLIQLFDQGVLKGQYGYDGKGRRVLKTVGGTSTVFHYDISDRLIEETDVLGHLLVDYVYRGVQPLVQVRKQGVSEAASYYHLDHLGTPKVMTDAARNVVWRVDSDPFGNEAGTPLKTVENNLRFPGQYYDQETGLNYNFHRDYDPKTGRYVEADPIGIRGGINIYAYAKNNSISETDVTGLWSTDAHNAIIEEFGKEMGLNIDMIKEMELGSREADSWKYQDAAHSYMHAMSSSSLSKKSACEMLRYFVVDSIAAAEASVDIGQAYFDIGFGLHAIMDSTSPPHADFQKWNITDFYKHGALPTSKEDINSLTPALLKLSVEMMRAAIGGDIKINCSCYK